MDTPLRSLRTRELVCRRQASCSGYPCPCGCTRHSHQLDVRVVALPPVPLSGRHNNDDKKRNTHHPRPSIASDRAESPGCPPARASGCSVCLLPLGYLRLPSPAGLAEQAAMRHATPLHATPSGSAPRRRRPDWRLAAGWPAGPATPRRRWLLRPCCSACCSALAGRRAPRRARAEPAEPDPDQSPHRRSRLPARPAPSAGRSRPVALPARSREPVVVRSARRPSLTTPRDVVGVLLWQQ